MEKEIRQIFNEIELNKRVKGYYYWIVLIQIAYNKDGFTSNKLTMENYYEIVSKELNTTRTRMERDLRTCIGQSKQNIINYFKYAKRVTNKSFLILMLKKLEET